MTTNHLWCTEHLYSFLARIACVHDSRNRSSHEQKMCLCVGVFKFQVVSMCRFINVQLQIQKYIYIICINMLGNLRDFLSDDHVKSLSTNDSYRPLVQIAGWIIKGWLGTTMAMDRHVSLHQPSPWCHQATHILPFSRPGGNSIVWVTSGMNQRCDAVWTEITIDAAVYKPPVVLGIANDL